MLEGVVKAFASLSHLRCYHYCSRAVAHG